MIAHRLFPRILRSVDSQDSGATAIEYGLIAGLIAIGIVGSLVGTRTSLSNAFGTAASQMGTASGATSAGAGPGVPVNDNPRSTFWASKTLASTPTTSRSASSGRTAAATTYKFTDGTSVTFNTNNFDTNRNYITILEPSNLTGRYAYLGANDVVNEVDLNNYSDSTFDTLQSGYYSLKSDGSITNGSITQAKTYVRNAQGQLVNQGIVAAPQSVRDIGIVTLQDLAYFKSISPSQ
jgi:pilus assembly protein Flp/PilA